MSTSPLLQRLLGLVAPEPSRSRDLLRRVRRRLNRQRAPRAEPERYRQMLLEVEPDRRELERQRREAAERADGPLFTLLAVAGEESAADLGSTLRSLRSQTWPGWELRLALAPGADAALRRAAGLWESREPRLRRVRAEAGEDSAAGLGLALAAAKGDYVGCLEIGDRLAASALFAIAGVLERHPDTDLVYADEDRLSASGVRSAPRLKPGWSPERLLTADYIGRPALARRRLVEEAGGLRAGFEGAEEWDLWLRLAERTEAVRHVAQVLCHRRRLAAETATERAAAGARAVEGHLRRRGVAAEASPDPGGRVRPRWRPERRPAVSVVVPNRDSPDLVGRCLESLLEGTRYAPLEVVVVDNGSRDPRVLELYERLEGEEKISVAALEGGFNYSAACNLGARRARGDLLLFLNNDVEVLEPDWLEEMVGWLGLPGVGVVGAKLLYDDGRIQHAGLAMGLGSSDLVGHLFHCAPEDAADTPFGSADEVRNLLGVTGACQLVSRELFERLGGFDEHYLLTHSDVAFCLEARRAGLRVVYTPFARLVHHEGSTRGRFVPREDRRRFAFLLRAAGIDSDPYFHPRLDARVALPALRAGSAPGGGEMLQRQYDQLVHPEMVSPPLDFMDPEAVRAAAAAAETALAVPEWSSAEVESSDAGAARFVIRTLLEVPRGRERFPRALTAGPGGEFCWWLVDREAARLGLSLRARRRVEAVFAEPPGAGVRRIFELRPDLQRAFPFALLPVGFRSFAQWLLRYGRQEYALGEESIWWFFIAASEDPATGLASTYLLNPDWQLFHPAAATAFGWRRLEEWLRERFELAPGWLETTRPPGVLRPVDELRLLDREGGERLFADPAALRDGAALREFARSQAAACEDGSGPDDAWWGRLEADLAAGTASREGINVISTFSYPSGVQQAANATVEALERAGWRTSRRDLPATADPLGADVRGTSTELLGLELFDLSLLHVQPDQLPGCYEAAGLAPRRGVRRIGVWYWEMESAPPPEWMESGRMLDELWAPTRFIAGALQAAVRIPVVPMLPGVPPPAFEPLPREALGLDPEAFLFCFVFDMCSVMERKNPLGLIRAFRRAFPRRGGAALVIKVLRGETDPTERRRLMRAAEEAGVTVIDRVLSRAESFALMDACDCYVSLHRSEGFGLTLAEAMYMGKPVIATGYAGNMDFMDSENGLLVDFERVRLERTYPPYPEGAVWAQPSEEHAARHMRWVYEHPAEARALGAKARADVSERLSLRRYGERMVRRLERLTGDSPGP